MELTQTEKLFNLLRDGKPYRTDRIVSEVYGNGLSLARVGARIFDVKKKYGVGIVGWHDKENPALYWYQMVNVPKEIIDKTCDMDEAMRGVVNKLKLFDLKSIELMNAYKAWQKAKPEAKESCKGTFVILYNQL
jgi:hypothetical protein